MTVSPLFFENEQGLILIPYDAREALTLQEAAEMARRSKSTVRNWCRDYRIGRRLVGGNLAISKIAMQMLMDNDIKRLELYFRNGRHAVAEYFERYSLCEILDAHPKPQNAQNAQFCRSGSVRQRRTMST
jgi:hypothetical protein